MACFVLSLLVFWGEETQHKIENVNKGVPYLLLFLLVTLTFGGVVCRSDDPLPSQNNSDTRVHSQKCHSVSVPFAITLQYIYDVVTALEYIYCCSKIGKYPVTGFHKRYCTRLSNYFLRV